MKPKPHEVYITDDAFLGPPAEVSEGELRRITEARKLLTEEEKQKLSQAAWQPFVNGDVRPRKRVIEDN